ncbi:phosphate/phosphite/phosphonate ABC transporter substrate-binding protein [Sulfurivermis fontis]|uniref:phosphate/phosphite/phosphonate ABC transporter substrate-binding protein n=1 Tax=Sulfurivermis fontis TaxID=1972068 RepID=UPI000FD7F1C9|nr:phosphate/phosphite/phosphonate ABC transporter substrate-binding protein [Sulfurivermis fontis]
MKPSLRAVVACLGVCAAVVLGGCQGRDEPEYAPRFSAEAPSSDPVYVFGVHPLHNPQRLHEVFSPLMAYLSAHIAGARFRLEASRNYAAYDEKLYARQFHFALPNPYQTINAVKHGYRVFGKMGDDDNFRGIILVRKDSGIREVRDLRGKAVSYPAPSALAATMLPQYFLHSHGIDVMHDIENRYVGSQESSIMNVYLGDVAAGATWPPPWRALSRERPELAAALEVRWQTDPLPNNGLVVLPEVPETVVAQVGRLLFSLHESPEGRRLLAPMELSRFEPADDATYAPVREFIHRFSAAVRPVE